MTSIPKSPKQSKCKGTCEIRSFSFKDLFIPTIRLVCNRAERLHPLYLASPYTSGSQRLSDCGPPPEKHCPTPINVLVISTEYVDAVGSKYDVYPLVIIQNVSIHYF
jgi:hypothetical protein